MFVFGIRHEADVDATSGVGVLGGLYHEDLLSAIISLNLFS